MNRSYDEVDVGHLALTRRLSIVLLQLESPMGKEKSTVERDGRYILHWVAASTRRRRVDFVRRATEALLSRVGRDVDLLIYPLHSVPLVDAGVLEDLQALADRHRCIIVPGGDVFRGDDGDAVRCPVLIPHRAEPVWVVKATTEGRERLAIDSGSQDVATRFVWTHDDDQCWMSVYLGADFTSHAVRDAISGNWTGPGLFVVPMHAPSTSPFEVYADVLSAQPGGTVTALCNCHGGEAAGRSGFVTARRTEQRRGLALQLPTGQSAATSVVLDLDAAVPAPSSYRSPVRDPRNWRLKERDGTLELQDYHLATHVGGGPYGVINPYIFRMSGKVARMAFVEAERYAVLAEQSDKEYGFELQAVLGLYDVIITHIAQFPSALIYDLTQTAGVHPRSLPQPHPRNQGGGEAKMQTHFPLFEIEDYHKVRGHSVTEAHRDAFAFQTAKPLPTPDQMTAIAALCRDWSAQSVSEAERRDFVEKKWLLGRSEALPGDVDAILCLFLDFRDQNLGYRLADFRVRILPEIIERDEVISAFSGSARNAPIDFVLKVRSDTRELGELAEEIHRIAASLGEMVTTTTHVVVRRLSTLQMDKALKTSSLNALDFRYKCDVLVPRLAKDDVVRLHGLSDANQQRVVRICHKFDNDFVRLAKPFDWRDWYVEGTTLRLATGLIYWLVREEGTDAPECSRMLQDPHNFLQSEVERKVRRLIEENLSDADIEQWRAPHGIHARKPVSKFSYVERLKILGSAIEAGLAPGKRELITQLFAARAVRNAFAHGDDIATLKDDEDGRDGLDRFLAALTAYVEFLSQQA